VVTAEGEGVGLVGMFVNPSLQRSGRAAFRQVGDLIDQGADCLGAPRVEAPQGEDLLELIENQEGHHRPVAGVPKIAASPVEVLPERLVAGCRRHFDLMGRSFPRDRCADLRHQVRPLG